MHSSQPREFVFSRYVLDRETGIAVFEYRIRFAERPEESYQETLTLPEETRAGLSAVPSELIDRWLQSLHLAFGMSYWKLYCPAKMVLSAGYSLSEEQARFWTTIYTKGLGEFFYRNQIDFRGLVNVPSDVLIGRARPITYPRRDRVLLPIGGGKDSMVSADLLKAAGISVRPFFKGSSRVQEGVLKFFSEPKLTVDGKLDPRMIERAKSGEAYNGHVPISIIWSFVAGFVATLCDYAWVAFSNEASASEGSVEYLGVEVNHQWSKSVEAERMAREYIHRYITPNVTTFSLLRPLHELAIAKLFARSPQYLGSVSSCNRNFVVSTAQPEREGKAYWCGTCPKCAFVFALLAPFIPKDQLVDAIGKNLFGDASLADLYRELLGVKGIKPFECVGTPDETRLAFHLVQQSRVYADEPIMRVFEQEVASRVSDWSALEVRVMTPDASAIAELPTQFQSIYQSL